jgi:hypothetical protein
MSSIVRRILAGLCLCAGLLPTLPSPVWADDVELTLGVKSGERETRTKFTETEPPAQQAHPRPVFRVTPGEPLVVFWKARHDGEKKTFKDVLIHFFVAPEEKVGQTAAPRLGKDVPHEGAVTLDFKPGAQARGEFTLRLDKTGSYLMRVETRGLINDVQHEDYAAMDLVVE